jgi:hypothetical protein
MTSEGAVYFWALRSWRGVRVYAQCAGKSSGGVVRCPVQRCYYRIEYLRIAIVIQRDARKLRQQCNADITQCEST